MRTNLASTLDFSQPNLNAPAIPVPPGFFGTLCPLTEIIPNKFDRLAELARALGIIL